MGSGFGILARPAGAYVIRGDEVKWLPAVDANRVTAGVFGRAGTAGRVPTVEIALRIEPTAARASAIR